MADMFASAGAYEGYMGRWSARLAPLFAGFVTIDDGGRVLDVGCGTGSMVQVVAERTEGGGIVGIDPAQPFVEFSRKRFSDPRISFCRGRAGALPCLEGTFDLSLSLLVFQLIPDVERAAMEMRRVTRPGGTVAACAWDGKGLEMVSALWEEVRRLALKPKNSAEGGRSCGRKGELAGLWRETGLVAVEEATLDIRTEFDSFDDYWLPLLRGVGPAGSYVARLDPEQRDVLRGALRQRLLGGRTDGRICLGARAWAVRGTVPA